MNFLATTLTLVTALSLGTSSALTVLPPENRWVTEGQETVSLSCAADRPIRRCAWLTPDGKTRSLGPGLTAEKGRLEHYQDEALGNMGCGITITSVETKDAGKWKCTVDVVEDGEVIASDAVIAVRLASPPTAVNVFSDDVTDDVMEVSAADFEEGDGKEVKCVVEGAMPKPEFKWFIGEDELTDSADTYDVEGEQWAQVLKYSPDAAHANLSLSCVIDHQALTDDLVNEASLVLAFTADAVNVFNRTNVSNDTTVSSDDDDDTNELSMVDSNPAVFALIVIVVVVFVLIGVVLVIYYTCFVPRIREAEEKEQEEVDSESQKDSSVDDDDDVKNASNVSMKSNGTVPDDAAAANKEENKDKKGFGERMASFFKFSNGATYSTEEDGGDRKEGAEKAGDEFVAVDLNAKNDDNAADTVTEDATDNISKDEENGAAPASSSSRPNFFRRIMKALTAARRPSSATTSAEMTETSDSAAAEEKLTEYEPEDKPAREAAKDVIVVEVDETVETEAAEETNTAKNTDV